MSQVYPSRTTPHGRFTLAKGDTAESFHCDNCGKDKKSKSVARWDKPDGSVVQLCNGCYGEVLEFGPRESRSK